MLLVCSCSCRLKYHWFVQYWTTEEDFRFSVFISHIYWNFRVIGITRSENNAFDLLIQITEMHRQKTKYTKFINVV